MQSLSYRTQELFKLVKNAFQHKRLAHSYLIVGSIRGEGKIFAEQMLAMIFCENQTENKPCNACNGCKLAIKHEHKNMIWIEPQRKSRQILIEHILLIRQHIFQTAFGGGWKGAVLLGAERMNIESSNMLLKTLEEPPPKSLFLLVAEHSEALLPTIVSRCQKLVLSEKTDTLPEDIQMLLIPILKGIVMSKGDLLQAMVLARSFIGVLKTIQEKVEDEVTKENELTYEDDPEAQAELEKLLQARIEARYREERAKLLNGILLWFRDFMLCINDMADKKVLFYKEEVEFIVEHSKTLNFSKIIASLDAIEDARYQLEQYLQEINVFERLFAKLANCFA